MQKYSLFPALQSGVLNPCMNTHDWEEIEEELGRALFAILYASPPTTTTATFGGYGFGLSESILCANYFRNTNSKRDIAEYHICCER